MDGCPSRRGTVALAVEPLEGREVPVAGFAAGGGLLQINATLDNAPHIIAVFDNGKNAVGNMTVFIDGVSTTLSQDNISQIQVLGGSGDSTIAYFLTGNLVGGANRNVTESLGSGTNTVVFDLLGNIGDKKGSAGLAINMMGGTGVDICYFLALNTTISTGSSVQMLANGNQDHTYFNAVYSGLNMGSLAVAVTAGTRGKAQEFINLTPQTGSTGSVFSQELGGPKKGLLETVIHPQPGANMGVFATVDGGGNPDSTAIVSPLVGVANTRHVFGVL
jgi:hypothetical protein